REPGRAPDLLGERAPDRIRDVGLAALEHRQSGRFVGHRLEDQAFHARRLAPVLLVGFQDQLDARLEGDEAVRTGADGRLLEAVVTHLLDLLLWDDPRGARRGRAEEGHEVRPGRKRMRCWSTTSTAAMRDFMSVAPAPL